MLTSLTLFIARVAIRLVLPIVFLVILRGLVARGAEMHLGLSPFMDEAARRQVGEALPAFLLEPKLLPGGTRVVAWDAWNLQRIAEFDISVREFDTARARALKLQRELGRLGQWLRQAAPAVEGMPAGCAAVRAPEWLFAASAEPASPRRTFVLLGSPFYRSPTEPAFDMESDARYPSDGHLALALRDSVFGVVEKARRLDRAAVFWCFFGQAIWANALHEERVTRFWSLFVQRQGGTLGWFSPDLSATFAQAARPALSPMLRAEIDAADEKPLMHSARPRTFLVPVPPPSPAPPVVAPAPLPAPPPPPPANEPAVTVAEPPAVVPAPQPASAPPPVVESVPAPIAPAAPPAPLPMPFVLDDAKTGIGIAWSASIDLDLYVRLRPGARELYYRQDRSTEGFLYRDERHANVGRQYEFIEFRDRGPIDLSQATIWVNYYSGRAAGVTGQIVLFERGRVRLGTFVLPASRGNSGREDQRRGTSPHWVQIRLDQLGEAAAPLARRPGE